MTPTPLWLTPVLRGCDLCLFGTGEAGERRCEHPHVTAGAPVPVARARAEGGACGPEALYLDMASWHPRPASNGRWHAPAR